MKRIFTTPLLVALTLCICLGCSNDDDVVEPAPPEINNVTSEENVATTLTSITISGSIEYENPEELLAYGVVWSTDPNPDITDNVIDESPNAASAVAKTGQMKSTQSATIDFTSEITDLSPNQTYYFRIFATTEQSTAYGEEMSYSTMSLAETTWDFHFLHDVEAGVTWHADVTFYEDGTAFYTEPDAPGTYDSWGTWSLEGDQLLYDMLGNGPDGSYYLTGTIEDGEMEGTYTWGEDDRPWTAVMYN